MEDMREDAERDATGAAVGASRRVAGSAVPVYSKSWIKK
jgi:hypothetical protein